MFHRANKLTLFYTFDFTVFVLITYIISERKTFSICSCISEAARYFLTQLFKSNIITRMHILVLPFFSFLLWLSQKKTFYFLSDPIEQFTKLLLIIVFDLTIIYQCIPFHIFVFSTNHIHTYFHPIHYQNSLLSCSLYDEFFFFNWHFLSNMKRA